MGDYNIDINVNMGGGQGNFNSLIQSVNQLNQNFANVGASATAAGKSTKMSFEEASQVVLSFKNGIKGVDTEIKKTRESLKQQAQLLKQLKIDNALPQDIKRVSDEISANEKKVKSLTEAQRRYNSTLGESKNVIKSTQNSFAGLIKTMNSLASVLGVSFGMYGVFRSLQFGIKTVSEFELAQKKLQSILADTSEGMKVMSDSAIEVGKRSIFGAKGVTELQIELAKMGFAKGEIIAMQQAVVNLATATQEDLAGSAEVVANIIRAYGLNASEATRVTDVMGKAFNDSALDLANFREAIKYVAPIAKQANFTLEETTAMLEQLSNAGIKGSLAGTGLTNIISRLGNESSKFVKTLGYTVNGFDEFAQALIELKKRGADLGDTFELVDRRAAAVFSILLEGVDTVEEFRKKLEESAGTMETQAGVQLDSIEYKTRLLKESWKAMILQLDTDTNVISGLARAFLNLGNAMVIAMGQPDTRIKKTTQSLLDNYSAIETLISSGLTKLTDADKVRFKAAELKGKEYYDNLSQLYFDYNERVRKAQTSPAGALPFGIGQIVLAKKMASLKNELNTQIDELEVYYKGVGNKLSGLATEAEQKAIQPFIDEFNNLAKSSGNLNKAWDIQYAKLKGLMEQYPKASLNASIYGKAIIAISEEFDRLNKTGIPNGNPNSEATKKAVDAVRKAAEEAIKNEIDLLKLKKENALAIVKLEQEGYEQKESLADTEYEYNKKIQELNLKLWITSGEDIVQAQEKNRLELINIELDYANKMDDIWDALGESESKKFTSRYEKLTKILLNNIVKAKEAIDKSREESEESDRKRNEKSQEFSKEKPIWAALMQKKDKYGQAIPFTEEDAENAKQLDKALGLAADGITKLADEWVSAVDKIVDARNRMVDEAQSALETEIQLAEAGFASNVTLKRKELEETKALRAKALEDQRRAQIAQAAIDWAMTESQLLVSAAQIFAQTSKMPQPWGLIEGIAIVGAMLAAFAGFTQKIKAANATKYESGGEVGGKRHYQGGTIIEAEKGEYVINRRSAAKYKDVIEAINFDDSAKLNRLYLDNMRGSIVSAKVSLDDSKDLKDIRNYLLNGSGKQVSYANGYRIEKNGNVTTRIRIYNN